MSTHIEELSLFTHTCRALAGLGLEIGPSGNLSFRTAETVLITPTGSEFSDITQPIISQVSLSRGGVRKKIRKPSSDVAAHIAIYESRPDVKAILHTHAHFVTLAAMFGNKIPALNTMQADYFGGPIECVPFSNHRLDGYGAGEYFSEGKAFLLEKHGGLLLFSEQDLQKITSTMQAFNEVCQLYYDYINIESEQPTMSPISKLDLDHLHKYYTQEYGN